MSQNHAAIGCLEKNLWLFSTFFIHLSWKEHKIRVVSCKKEITKVATLFYMETAREKSQPLPQLQRISGGAPWKRKCLMKFHAFELCWGILMKSKVKCLYLAKYYLASSTSPFSILLKPLISLSAPDRRWFTRVWQWLLFNLTEEHMPLSIKQNMHQNVIHQFLLSRTFCSLFFDIELEQERNISIEWRQQSSNVWQTFSIFLLQGATCC